jgi:hypothetical protein
MDRTELSLVGVVLAICIACVCISGCDGRTIEQKELGQKSCVPILITEKDGVRVYKVRDNTGVSGRDVYFSVPAGDTHWEEKHGKSTVPMQTNGVPAAKK